jgi:hypothetical protein
MAWQRATHARWCRASVCVSAWALGTAADRQLRIGIAFLFPK